MGGKGQGGGSGMGGEQAKLNRDGVDVSFKTPLPLIDSVRYKHSVVR
jgi:hypothetical protein